MFNPPKARRITPLWRGAQSVGRTLKEHAHRLFLTLQSARRLSIAAMLTIIIASVAVVVLLTNVIVADVVRIETVTRITVAPDAPHSRVAPPAVSTTATTEKDDGRNVTAGNHLLTAVDRLTAVLHDRLADRTSANEAAFKRASTDLERALSNFTTLNRLVGAVRSHHLQADRMVTASDLRRDARDRYNALFESLNARAKAAINGSWKIFGRVVARQSLLQLSADIDSLRRHPPVATAEGVDDNQDSLSAEATVHSDLAANERAFRSTQGDAWFENMRREIAELGTLRTAIVQGYAAETREFQDFLQASAKLALQVQDASASGRASKAKAPQQLSAPQTPTLPPRQTIHTSSSASEPVTDRQNHRLVERISICILIFLTVLCVSMTVCIVRPVKRLQKATARLASGNEIEPLPRERIREMDSLASSFNSMAAEICRARLQSDDYRITLEKQVIERTHELQVLADHDPLTGLPNRRELFTLLNAAIERAAIDGQLVGVFFIDVDNFKNINDSMGHAFGDRVLVSLAHRLQSVVKPAGFAARLGGDEFTVVIGATSTLDDIRAAGLRMVQAFHQPLVVDGRDLSVSISVGASVYPTHESNSEALLKAADAALFRAKHLGRSQLTVFTPQLLKDAVAKFSTEQGLRRAIERGEFELVFQPEVSAESLETVLVEALIRWRMPDGRLAAPADFLAVAEESGLIVEISDWVIRTAIQTAAVWYHGQWPKARVAINISSRQLVHPDFVETVLNLLALHNLPAKCIELN